MDTLKARQKKRKTRRCLDELRKRTREPNDVCNKSNKNTIDKVHKMNTCCLKIRNYITANRLTLLKKTVKSETVTRSRLTNLKNKKKKLNRKNIESGFHKQILSPEAEQNDVNTLLEKHSDTITEGTSGIENESLNIQIPEEGKECNPESPKSIILFSPNMSEEDKIARNSDHNGSSDVSILSSPPPSPILNSNSSSIWYDYFMNKLERQMDKVFPEMTCDCVEECKAKLLEICRKNQNTEAREYNDISDSDLINDDVPTEETLIQNPNNYLGHSWQYSHYTIASEVDATSSTTSNSSHSIGIPFRSPFVSAAYDTPEYSYYPHRLN